MELTQSSDVRLYQGSVEILERAPLLMELAAQWDQAGAMNWLEYFLAAPSALRKQPYLVLILRGGIGSGEPRRDDISAAVVMFEYCVVGLPTRAFSTDDISGFRTVLAPAGQRAAAAAAAANAVLEQGAHFALITYSDAEADTGAPMLTKGHRVQWARQVRPVAKTLPLAADFETTLATLGKATRFNLRYYRRRLMNRLPCEFVRDARGLLSEAECTALNGGSLNPVEPELFNLQYRSACDLPGGFVVGLRDPEGKWLSLIGGWRQDAVTVLHWQVNASGYEKDSIGTVMRSFFLEHEVERGARRVVIYGGTTHSMANSFVREQAMDLVVCSLSWKATVLRQLCRLYCGAERYLGKTNFLARTIGGAHLVWHPVAPEHLASSQHATTRAQAYQSKRL